MHIDYPLAPDIIEAKKTCFLIIKWRLLAFAIFPLTMLKKYENLQFYLRLGLKLGKYTEY